MDESTVWWLLAGAAVALELVTGTFFLLVLALGLAAAALAAHAGASLALQFVTAALVGGGGVVAWQRWRKRHSPAPRASDNPDVNLDIGETVQVEHWLPDGTARVKYRGAEWTVAVQNPLPLPSPGAYRVVSVHGNRLIVRAT